MKLPKITKHSVLIASAIVAVTFSGGVAVFAFSQAPEPSRAATEVKTGAKKAKKEEKSDTSDQTPSEVQTAGQADQSAAIPAGNRPGVHSGRLRSHFYGQNGQWRKASARPASPHEKDRRFCLLVFGLRSCFQNLGGDSWPPRVFHNPIKMSNNLSRNS